MSEPRLVELVLSIIKEQFGQTCEAIVLQLFKNGRSQLNNLLNCLKVSEHEICSSLLVLLQHNCIECSHIIECYNTKNEYKSYCLYEVNSQNIINRLRLPRYLYYLKHCYGDLAEQLVTVLTNFGKLTLEHCIQIVTRTTTRQYRSQDLLSRKKIANRMVMIRLIKENLIMRVYPYNILKHINKQETQSNSLNVKRISIIKPNLQKLEAVNYTRNKFLIAAIFLIGNRIIEESYEIKNTCTKHEPGSKNLLWRINHTRFDLCLCHDLCTRVLSERLDKESGQIIQLMLQKQRKKIKKNAKFGHFLSLPSNVHLKYSAYVEVLC
jgi:hypothetical protein